MNEPCWATRNPCGSEFSTPTGRPYREVVIATLELTVSQEEQERPLEVVV
jgi:hypothetical protein